MSAFFHRYLDHEHYRHCVPSNVSSGLATLPLDHVWVDGKENTSWSTNKMLPTGEKLDGKKAYSMILSYFTTNEMTPDDVHNLGHKQLTKLYPQVGTLKYFHMVCNSYCADKLSKCFRYSIP